MFGIRRSTPRGVSLALAAASLAGIIHAGCGGSDRTPLPKTYPVSGKVFYKGGQPLPGGVIQFQSNSDPTLTTKGDIGPDGTFELVTLLNNEQLHGATEGQFHVTVIPRMSENKPTEIFQLSRVYTVKAEENSFSIKLETSKSGARR